MDLHKTQHKPGLAGPRAPSYSGGAVTQTSSTNLHRNRSTKQLINRYESLGQTLPCPSLNLALPTLPKSLAGSMRKKDNSPIRDSIRNLFSRFKKGKGPHKEKQEEMTSSMKRKRSSADDPFLVSCDSYAALEVPISAAPADIYIGPLLYLSESSRTSSSAQTLPVWTMCTASLRSDHILITWLSTHGNPSAHSISLNQCGDVRSLNLGQIDPEERALLPLRGDSEGLKVFEMLFEGRPREKFAAKSVQERAGWVSAIWGAILSTPNRSSIQHNEEVLSGPDRIPSQLERVIKQSAPIILERQTDSGHTRTISLVIERELPPTPRESTPQNVPSIPQPSPSVYPFTSPSVYPPSHMTSRSSSPSRSKSPSIAILSQLSVVRQRLAEIEQNSSRSLSPGLTSPSPSIRSSRFAHLSAPTPIKHDRSELPLLHTKSFKYYAGGSIFDSYGGDDVEFRPGDNRNRVYNLSSSPEQANEESIADNQYWSGAAIEPTNVGDGLPCATPSKTTVAPAIGHTPIVELLQDQAAKHYDQTANLSSQIISLQHEVENLPNGLASFIMGHGDKSRLDDIHSVVLGLDKRTEFYGKELHGVREKLDVLGSRILPAVPMENGNLASTARVVQLLEDLTAQFGSHIPEVVARRSAIQEGRMLGVTDEPPITVMNNLRPSTDSSPSSPATNWSIINTKVDQLLASLQSRVVVPDASPSDEGDQIPADGGQLSCRLKEVISLFTGSEDRWQIQAQQQTDSVRYLNELNNWLEAFVNNGTSQIQAVANGVAELRKELGCSLHDPGDPGEYQNPEPGNNLLTNIRQLLVNVKSKEQEDMALRTSVHELTARLNTYLQTDLRNSFAPETVVSMIDRQRQDHEGLLRTLTAELSNEIRGERLRFVEAMKEATAINVQIHVEQFKEELSREVQGMTHEVDRLHREKQVVEGQISDLFTFYSKQKAGVSFPGAVPPTRPHSQGQARPAPQRFDLVQRTRPLPIPTRR